MLPQGYKLGSISEPLPVFHSGTRDISTVNIQEIIKGQN
jgi:hypothetical protein